MRIFNGGDGGGITLLAGASHRALAQDLATEMGVALGEVKQARFPDGEFDIEVRAPVRGTHVVVLQTLQAPAGEFLLELSLIADACYRQGAKACTAVIPYLGYTRHDRRDSAGRPLGARVIADLLAAGHIDGLVCLDWHTWALEGCFRMPIEHATATPALLAHLRSVITGPSVVVSPDVGALRRAEAFATALGLPMAVVNKERLSGSTVKVHGVIGEIAGKCPILIDDMISTGATLAAAARAVIAHRAKPPIIAVATHGVFSGAALQTLAAVPFARVVTTDSLPAPVGTLPFSLDRVRCAPALINAIARAVGMPVVDAKEPPH